MATIRFSDQAWELQEGSSVLDLLLSEGQTVPYSCRTGACQTCLMKSTQGLVPDKAQVGIKASLKAQGYFLACQCQPENDLDIALADASSVRVNTVVIGHEKLTEKVVQITLKKPEKYQYIPGQYLTLWKNATEGRSYSLASVPELDPDNLEIHVRRVEGGEISAWLYDEVKVGDVLTIQEPVGHCCYVESDQMDPLLLAGAGTGLAPLIGIARDALNKGHRGELHLFHSARNTQGLYKHTELHELSEKYENFYYHPVLSLDENSEEKSITKKGDLTNIILEFLDDPKQWRYYLCGSENRVTTLRKKLFLAGAAMKNIYADAFISKGS